MTRLRALVEAPAGLAAFSLYVHGGKHCRPPISRLGNKAGYAHVLAAVAGVRAGQGAGAYVWAEADADVRGLLRAYPDPAMLLRVAEIIRGWAGEEPRALWERLRAERKARKPVEEAVAGWIQIAARSVPANPSGFKPMTRGDGSPESPDGLWQRVRAVAEYAQIAASNRLINVAGPDLTNTGKGGTTFGGEFARPAGETAEAFERVAGWVAEGAFLHQGSFQMKGVDAGIGQPEGVPESATHGVKRPVAAILGDSFPRLASRWPPVYVTARIPTAAELSEILGTPGDLEGVLLYQDPPYSGTTGYGANLTRAEVVSAAIEAASIGARVMVSEAVAIPELVALGWHATDIGGERRGQKRTFARVATEYVTTSFPPVERVERRTQVGLFGAPL